MKKIALVHYWLTNMRGGESVVAEFCRLWPKADIFTHAYNPEKISDAIKKHRISCSFINRLPGARKNCQIYLPLMPTALQRLDFSGYDLIISSESGPAKGLRKPAGTVHICYCHTPMRYLWDMYDDYYRQAGLEGKIAMRLFCNYLRHYDQKSAVAVDHFIANSQFVAERIKRIYGRTATVIPPPVDVNFFSRSQGEERHGAYYLFVGQLIHYKRPDLAIAACRKLKRRLIVVGDGPWRDDLQKLAAGSEVIFTGRTSDEELRRLYHGARALLFPGIEDFGIVPLEAQAAGLPVIALGHGGALETVVNGQTGVFFTRPKVDELCAAIEIFESMSFTPETLRRQAEKFSCEQFRDQILKFVTAYA